MTLIPSVSRNPVQPQTTKQQQSVGFSALKCNMLTCESVHPVRSIKKSIHVTDHIQTVLWHTDVCTRSYGLIDSTFRWVYIPFSVVVDMHKAWAHERRSTAADFGARLSQKDWNREAIVQQNKIHLENIIGKAVRARQWLEGRKTNWTTKYLV